MECRNPIENALTAEAPGNAAAVMERAGWRYRKGKCALRAIPMAAGNARTVAAWAVSMPPETLNQMTNDEFMNSVFYSSLLI
jgi:hypothetical protein